MVTLEINNRTDYKPHKKNLTATATKSLKGVGLKQDYQISLALVKERQMKSINSERRGEEKPAGVLTFADKDLEGEFFEPEEDGIYLGEIFLCPAYIKKKAKKHKRKPKDEFLRYFKHGLLHLAGLSHSEMEKLQNN